MSASTAIAIVCIDCHGPGTVHYVFGAVRCEQCADTFSAANRAEKAAAEKAWLKANPCETCGEQSAIAYYGCQECCDHEPDADEGMHCLSCGKDCSGGGS